MVGKAVFEVILGTYEKYLVGFSLYKDKSNDGYKFERTFAEEAHNGSIKSVATSSQHLISGGTDECIKIFDMTDRRDIGSLFHQEGTITSLTFIDDEHFISGSEDSTVCVWSAYKQNCLKTLKGHKNRVNGVSVHPSGGLALSISKDKTIRTWDLVKGRCAFASNIHEVGNSILWSPDGRYFVVLFDRRIDVYDVNIAAPVHQIPSNKVVNCAKFLNERILMIGLDDGCLEMLSITKNRTLRNQKMHETRIKDICLTSKGVLTASSDGIIKLSRGKNFAEVATTNLECRINSMSVYPPQTVKLNKN